MRAMSSGDTLPPQHRPLNTLPSSTSKAAELEQVCRVFGAEVLRQVDETEFYRRLPADPQSDYHSA